MLPLHVTAGLLALAFGFVAISAPKGQPLHRKAGTLFVYAMMVMTGAGFVVAVMRGQPLNIIAAGLACYLTATGLLTVLRDSSLRTRLSAVAMVGGATVAAFALACVAFNVDLIGSGRPASQAGKAFVLVFGAFAGLGAWGDFMMLKHGIQGHRRIARHLWRMGLALLIATMAFFLGQARQFPESLRIPALLAIPVVFVLLVMLYWLGRVLITKTSVRA